MPKQTKTFQSFSSPLNISWSLQTFLWNHRQQSLLQGLPWRKEVSSLSSFCHIHPSPLKTKVSLACAHQSQKTCLKHDTLFCFQSYYQDSDLYWSFSTFSWHFIFIFMSVPECIQQRCPSGRWSHTVLSFIFSVSVQFSVISNGNKLPLCCINAEMRLLAWLPSSGIGSGIRPGVGTDTWISIGSGISISSTVGIDWNNLHKRI